MNLINKNILSNYFNKAFSFISIFIFVPVYIKMLNIESYAVINFYTVLLSILFIADAGLTATFSREVARTNDKEYLGNLLKTIERTYIIICLVIVLGVFLLSDLIASFWLQSDIYTEKEISIYIIIMGCTISIQLFSSLFTGGLMGLEKQVLSNSLQVFNNLFRSGVVLVPLYLYPNLLTFFLWQLIVSVIFLIITRNRLRLYIKTKLSSFDFKILKNIKRFALGMAVMALLSALNTQSDKIIVSSFLSLSDFGYYSLASLLAQAPMIITLPIAIAVLPQLTKMSEDLDYQNLERTYHKYSFLISSISSIVTLVLLLFTEQLMFIWTGDEIIVEKTSWVLKILVVGGFFLANQLMPYYLSIANGHTKTNIYISVSSIIFFIPSTIYLTTNFGLIGSSIPWLVLNAFIFVILGYLIISKFLMGNVFKWFFISVLVPILVSSFVSLSFYFLFFDYFQNFKVIILIIFIFLISIILNYLIYFILSKKPIKNNSL